MDGFPFDQHTMESFGKISKVIQQADRQQQFRLWICLMSMSNISIDIVSDNIFKDRRWWVV